MNVSIESPHTENDVMEAYNFANNILIFSKEYPRSLQFYINVFQLDPRYLLIAKSNNEVVGVALSSEKDENTLLVGEVAVAEKYRGIGIGSRLMRAIEQNSRLLNKNKVFLAAKNGEAENFYLKNGYIPMLYIQVPGNNKLDKIKEYLSAKIEWEKTGDGFSKIILMTSGVDKDFQKNIEESLSAKTQYLFTKNV